MRAILTLNAGSSSLKVGVFGETGAAALATAQADRIGPQGRVTLHLADAAPQELPQTADGHDAALAIVLSGLRAAMPALEVIGVGHRVVHGGPDFARPVVLDDAILTRLEALCPFAPLHQPHNLAGVQAARRSFPAVPQVAAFDTAFHRAHPWVNDTFALPRSYYDRGVRRYGFHGLSYDYISRTLRETMPEIAAGRVVVAHLGNGASLCAIENGSAVASTMGFSALDGLPMGTRCGQLDPGVVLYLIQQEGLSPDAVADLLYKRSGLLGLSGLSNDMRTLEQAGSPEAAQAIEYFVFRIQREIGAMAAAMAGVDALVFCGGIGEHSSHVRGLICARLGWMGIELDAGCNAGAQTRINAGPVPVLVIPTNEELVIADAVRDTLSGESARP